MSDDSIDVDKVALPSRSWLCLFESLPMQHDQQPRHDDIKHNEGRNAESDHQWGKEFPQQPTGKEPKQQNQHEGSTKWAMSALCPRFQHEERDGDSQSHPRIHKPSTTDEYQQP